ncbi:MAG: hypothetical protein Q4E87_05350, partial [bacterium]|nr:hypothetical protein [bacterium]
MLKRGKIIAFGGIAILLAAVVEIFYVCFLPNFINIEQKLPLVEKLVKEYTDKTLNAENVEIKTFPTFAFKISAKSLTLYNKDKTKLFSAENPSIKIQ